MDDHYTNLSKGLEAGPYSQRKRNVPFSKTAFNSVAIDWIEREYT